MDMNMVKSAVFYLHLKLLALTHLNELFNEINWRLPIYWKLNDVCLFWVHSDYITVANGNKVKSWPESL